MKDHNARLAQTAVTTAPDTFAVGVRDMLRILEETHNALLEINAKLDAITKHLGVPYEKPPTD